MWNFFQKTSPTSLGEHFPSDSDVLTPPSTQTGSIRFTSQTQSSEPHSFSTGQQFDDIPTHSQASQSQDQLTDSQFSQSQPVFTVTQAQMDQHYAYLANQISNLNINTAMAGGNKSGESPNKLEFHGRPHQDWYEFRENLERWVSKYGLDNENIMRRLPSFFHELALEEYKRLTPEERIDFETALDSLERKLVTQDMRYKLVNKFHETTQQAGMSVSEFYSLLLARGRRSHPTEYHTPLFQGLLLSNFMNKCRSDISDELIFAENKPTTLKQALNRAIELEAKFNQKSQRSFVPLKSPMITAVPSPVAAMQPSSQTQMSPIPQVPISNLPTNPVLYTQALSHHHGQRGLSHGYIHGMRDPTRGYHRGQQYFQGRRPFSGNRGRYSFQSRDQHSWTMPRFQQQSYQSRDSANANRPPTPTNRSPTHQQAISCQICRRSGHTARDCWNDREACQLCFSTNHSAHDCPQRRSRLPHQQNRSNSASSSPHSSRPSSLN